MKYLVLVGDGMGDLPVPELDGLTPLAAARTPTMDSLAQNGELFLLQTIPEDMAPGSDIANLSLLGYRPENFYTGRAPLEAASMNITLAADETACRCNLVTLDFTTENRVRMIDYSAGHITSAEARELIKALSRLSDANHFQFHAGVSYRHLMIYKGDLPNLGTVPPHDHIGKDVTEFWNRYQSHPPFKALLSAACSELAEHPVNIQRRKNNALPANSIWLWGEGKSPVMTSITEQYGISGALISAVDLLKGIGIYGGLEVINVPGATGYLDTNYLGKAEAALNALQNKDFVFVHVEAPDEAGHQGLIKEKIQAIEDFDEKIVKPILTGMQMMSPATDFRLVVTMDHFTPVKRRTHVSEPVPVLLYDSRLNGPKSGLDYTEKNGRQTGIKLENGQLFLEKLLEVCRTTACK